MRFISHRPRIGDTVRTESTTEHQRLTLNGWPTKVLLGNDREYSQWGYWGAAFGLTGIRWGLTHCTGAGLVPALFLGWLRQI